MDRHFLLGQELRLEVVGDDDLLATLPPEQAMATVLASGRLTDNGGNAPKL